MNNRNSRRSDWISQKLEDAVDSFRRNGIVPEHAEFYLHFLWGNLNQPGAIRKTAAARNEAKITAQIRELDRPYTYLWLISELARKSNHCSIEINLEVTKDVGLSVALASNKVFVSKGLVSVLCPDETAKRYLTALNEEESGGTGSAERGVLREQMDRAVARAFGRIEETDTETQKLLLDLHYEEWSEPQRRSWYRRSEQTESSKREALDATLWRVLTAIQSGLMFLMYPSNGRRELEGLAQGLVFKGDTIFPPMVVAFCYPEATRLKPVDLRELKRGIQERLGKTWDWTRRRSRPLAVSESAEKALYDKLKGIFPIGNQRCAAMALQYWVLQLLVGLKGALHEGKQLDFWFVLGDQSQFRDSSAAEFLEIYSSEGGVEDGEGTPEADPLGCPLGDEPPPKRLLKRAVDLLSAEHFPWFRHGEYALFFDVTNVIEESQASGKDSASGNSEEGGKEKPPPPLRPAGLVRIVGSSWEQLILEARRGIRYSTRKRSIWGELPACFVSFTSEDLRETGVYERTWGSLEHKYEQWQMERLLILRESEWVVAASTERIGKLRELLEKLLQPCEGSGIASEEATKMAELLVHLADNPDEGGTIVFMADGEEGGIREDFVKMGSHWKVGDHDLERRVLMTHDGATLRWPKASATEAYCYRRLLGAWGEANGVSKKLVERLVQSEHLAGSGGRRWSSALTALHKDVVGVVVVSQDGLIQVLWKEGKDSDRRLWRQRIPQKEGVPLPENLLVRLNPYAENGELEGVS